MLKLVQTDIGIFDLAFDDPDQDDALAAAATVVYAALFTDARAPASRVPAPFERRGWWAEESAGSALWHVRRQPLGSSARNEALAIARRALVAHGLTDVEVSESAHSAGSVSGVFMDIRAAHNGRKFLVSVPL